MFGDGRLRVPSTSSLPTRYFNAKRDPSSIHRDLLEYRLPRISQGTRASVGLRSVSKLTLELGEQRPIGRRGKVGRQRW